jgi:hypothetical protein
MVDHHAVVGYCCPWMTATYFCFCGASNFSINPAIYATDAWATWRAAMGLEVEKSVVARLNTVAPVPISKLIGDNELIGDNPVSGSACVTVMFGSACVVMFSSPDVWSEWGYKEEVSGEFTKSMNPILTVILSAEDILQPPAEGAPYVSPVI